MRLGPKEINDVFRRLTLPTLARLCEWISSYPLLAARVPVNAALRCRKRRVNPKNRTQARSVWYRFYGSYAAHPNLV